MKKIKSVLVVLSGVLLISTLAPQQAEAQFGIGASYEIRDEDPQNGFGVRIEKGILNKLPVVNLALRAHFSNFSEENQVNLGNQSGTYSREIQDYDFGVAAIGGVNIGLLKPYVGVGLGSNTVDIQRSEVENIDLPENNNDSKIYWNALVGAEISPIPLLKPFVEYRYTSVGEDFFKDAQNQNIEEISSKNGRIIFGVLLRF